MIRSATRAGTLSAGGAEMGQGKSDLGAYANCRVGGAYHAHFTEQEIQQMILFAARQPENTCVIRRCCRKKPSITVSVLREQQPKLLEMLQQARQIHHPATEQQTRTLPGVLL